ncbi:MAG: hypothetical protein JWO58_3365 [Chitinophagaceae bacterium]|nr:hypothetical protein [Chitinophagaceae bacterium]
MPRIKLPSSSGDWARLDRRSGVEFWQRDMKDPGGDAVRFFVVGAEHTPETWSSPDLDEARRTFEREVGVAGDAG